MLRVVGCKHVIEGDIHSAGVLRCVDWYIGYRRFGTTHRSHLHY
jgi:hypothetical protein